MQVQVLFNPNLRSQYQDTQLRSLAGKLINGMQVAAVRRNSIIVNHISPAIQITTDENLLAAAINDLLAFMVSRSTDNCIRITAKTFSNLVLLHFTDNNNNNHRPGISESDFNHLQPVAAAIGGCITICNHHPHSETLALSILDMVQVA